jgi:hypothetical protein
MALMSAWTHGHLGSAGPRAQKVPEDESEHGEDDHQDRPKHLRAGVRAALKDIDDRPDVGDQDNQTEYALVLHAAPRFEYLGHHN